MPSVGGLPYPAGTDKVMNGDDAMRDLATAIDRNPNAVLPASQVAVPLASGWVVIGGSTLYVMAINGWVFLGGRVSRTSGTGVIIGTIPVGYRPPVQTLSIIGSYNNASSTAGPQTFLVIDANGVITANVASSPAFGTNTIFVVYAVYPRGAAA